MIQFNELKINSEGTKLIIDVSVKNLNYYTNVYLDKIIIDNQDTFIETGPSTKAIYTKIIDGNEKSFRLELDNNILSIKDNLFFVYVKVKGVPSADTPCGMDNIITVGSVLYALPLYCNMLNKLQLEYKNVCNIPRHFIDSFLRYKGLQLALVTGNNLQAIEYYNSLMSNKSSTLSNNCGCYGR